MPLTEQERNDLKQVAREIRLDLIDLTGWCGGSHIGGSLSMVEILTLCYWKYMKNDPANPELADRDRFVLSKGHAGAGHAVVLAKKGYFPKEELKEFNNFGSMLGMHLDCQKVPGVEVSTGSMGHGMPQAAGMALGAKTQKQDWNVFCVIGDGESDEGSIWEAAMAASHFKLDNLICFLDRNHLMIDGPTEEVMSLEPLPDKWKAFGFNTIVVNGHDLEELAKAIDNGLSNEGSPTMIICETVKGKGVDFMENQPGWHYGALSADMVEQAKKSVGE